VIGGAYYFITRYAIYPDGSIWLGDPAGTSTEYHMYFPSCPAEGQEWITFERDTVQIATDTTVVVPAGTFSCLKVVRWRHAKLPDDAGTYSEHYYASGVGQVMSRRSEGYAPQNAEVYMELRSYSVH
jgi:hypothetical protein